MRTHKLVFLKVGIILGAFLVLILGAGPAGAVTITKNVDCGAGQTIANALAQAPLWAGAEVKVIVKGVCNENVTVKRDDVTLDGQGTATINGTNPDKPTIHITGRGITIKRFTITGGGSGIEVVKGGAATIDNNTIQNTGSTGVSVRLSSHADITNNTIRNNQEVGIEVGPNSSANIGVSDEDEHTARPNVIQNNGSGTQEGFNGGISIADSSHATIVGNTISNNVSHGIEVKGVSSARVSGNTINGNGRHGILVTGNSAVIIPTPHPANETTVNNEFFGIRCQGNSSAGGSLGTLNGKSGAESFEPDCASGMTP